MPWTARFDEPIKLPDGTTLETLRDAIQYLGKTIPKKERDHPAVITAATILTRTAEGRLPMMMAHIATMKAILRHEERVFNTERKETHWGNRKLKRDQ